YDRLERPVRLMQHDSGRRFIDLSRFAAHEAIFHHAYPSHAVLARAVVQTLHEREAIALPPIERDPITFLEADRVLAPPGPRILRPRRVDQELREQWAA